LYLLHKEYCRSDTASYVFISRDTVIHFIANKSRNVLAEYKNLS